MSEFFPKNLTDIVISLQSNDDNDADNDNDVTKQSDCDKEVEQAEFLLRVAKETLQALAFLDFKGIVHTSLVSYIVCTRRCLTAARNSAVGFHNCTVVLRPKKLPDHNLPRKVCAQYLYYKTMQIRNYIILWVGRLIKAESLF